MRENSSSSGLEGGVLDLTYEDGINTALNDVLDKLSDLEKEEKPIEGFDGEFSKFSNDVDAEHPFPICVDEYKDFARHFYELGRQSKPKVSEDVETEALRSAGVLLSEHFEDEDDDAIRTTALRCWKGGVIHGADWQRNRLLPMIDNICKGCRIQHEKENPVSEGLEDEITEFIANHYEVDYYDGLQHHGEYLDTYDVEDIARHFAQWGAEHRGNSEIPKDLPTNLDEAARLYSIPRYMKDVDKEHIEEYPYNKADKIAFKAGAMWMREQMTKTPVIIVKEEGK